MCVSNKLNEKPHHCTNCCDDSCLNWKEWWVSEPWITFESMRVMMWEYDVNNLINNLYVKYELSHMQSLVVYHKK